MDLLNKRNEYTLSHSLLILFYVSIYFMLSFIKVSSLTCGTSNTSNSFDGDIVLRMPPSHSELTLFSSGYSNSERIPCSK